MSIILSAVELICWLLFILYYPAGSLFMKPYLIVSPNFVKTGGQDQANLALATYLAANGAELHLVGYTACDDLLSRPGVMFHPVPRVCNSDLLSEPLVDFIGKFWASRISKRGGRVVVNGGNCDFYDVNWIHYVHAVDPVTLTSSLKKNFKAVLAHNFFRWREQVIVRKARVIIAHSQQAKRDVVQRLGVQEETVHVVPLGTNGDLFHPADKLERAELRSQLELPQERLLACFIGGFSGLRKGFDVLFAAWQSLCSEPLWDVDLLAIGSGPDLENWKARALQAGLESRIRFLGMRHDIPALLRSSDVYVLPSRYDTYSLATQEALCCGLPAFVSSSTGIAERYPPELKELLLPNPENAEDLVMKLKCWRGRVDHYRELVAPFAQRIRNYSWETMAKSIVNIIETT
jgi:glycosyltransferase involved in cell wall biosynthesis